VKTASLLASTAVLAAVLAAAFLSFANTYSGESCEVVPGSAGECSDTSGTLAEENGKWVYGLLAVPVVIAAAGLAAIACCLPKGIAWSLAGLALAGCLIAIFSIGVFFLPAALLLLSAAATDRARVEHS
jgi:hypothetical protein